MPHIKEEMLNVALDKWKAAHEGLACKARTLAISVRILWEIC